MIPELKGRFDGFSLRVPTATVSVIDFVAITSRPVTAETANAALKAAADGPMKGLLGLTDEPLVSMDFKGDDRSSIVDGALDHGRRRQPAEGRSPGTTTSGATPAGSRTSPASWPPGC